MNKQLIKSILSILISSQRRKAVILLITIIIGMLFETLGIGLIVPVISFMTQNDIAKTYPRIVPLLNALGNPTHKNLILYGMVSLVFLYFVKMLFLAFLAWRETSFNFKLLEDLTQKLFNSYLHQPYTFHLQHNSTQLMHNITHEISLFVFYVVAPLLRLVSEILVVLGLSILLFIIEPIGASFSAIVLGGATFLFYRGTKEQISRWGVSRKKHEASRIMHLQQGISGVKDAKLLGREKNFAEKYRFHNEQSVSVGKLYSITHQLPRLGIEFLAMCGLVSLVLTMMYQGRSIASIVPVMGVFAASAFRLMPSLSRSLAALQSIRYGIPVVIHLQEELARTYKEESSEDRIIDPFVDSLRVCDVSFTYPNSHTKSLDKISLTIHKGECVGFIGQSGSGKSTLVDVILGLLPPESGKIEVDGFDIQNGLRKWQNQIGYVPQSIFLTDDSLLHNIAFGISEEQIDQNAAWSALKSAQLEDFVKDLPKGINTVVGERGVRLSGGQRQRIGIARALYHNPTFLVLDEATSALDSETEAEVMNSVFQLSGTKTILIVAHRLSTVSKCDRVYKMIKGAIIKEGLFDEVTKEILNEKIELKTT